MELREVIEELRRRKKHRIYIEPDNPEGLMHYQVLAKQLGMKTAAKISSRLNKNMVRDWGYFLNILAACKEEGIDVLHDHHKGARDDDVVQKLAEVIAPAPGNEPKKKRKIKKRAASYFPQSRTPHNRQGG